MHLIVKRWLMVLLVTVVVLVSGCASNQSTALSSSTNPASPPESITGTAKEGAKQPRLDGNATVDLIVKGGTITIEVDGKNAPVTAGNFVDLVQKEVYNGSAFHRVVRQPEPFVVQGGDPQSKDPKVPIEQLGTGGYVDAATGQTRYVPLEIKPAGATKPIYGKTFEAAGISNPPQLRHYRGAVAMARSSYPDSASSQFYITLADVNFLDGNYAVFGKVTSGMEIVDKIQQGDRIESAKVTAGLENLKT
ncbi:MAG TPA: peptidylprolyl isomerase [Coleofasciculaceae cyanobacterium]